MRPRPCPRINHSCHRATPNKCNNKPLTNPLHHAPQRSNLSPTPITRHTRHATNPSRDTRRRYQHWDHQPRYDAAEHEFRRKQVSQHGTPNVLTRFMNRNVVSPREQVVQRTQELEGVLNLILAAAAPSPASSAAASSSDFRVETLEGNATHTAAGTGHVTVTSPLPPALQVRVGLVADDSLPLVHDPPRVAGCCI